MKETIKQLRAICQKEKIMDRKMPCWYTVHRKISIYITRFLLNFNITANQVSLLSIFFGLAGAVLLSISGFIFNIFGFLGFYFYYLLDRVDGEIARYRKEITLKGIYLDEIGHLIMHPLFFIALAINLFNLSKNPLILYIGFCSAFFFCFLRVNTNLAFTIFSKKVLNNILLIKKLKNKKAKSDSTMFSRNSILDERKANKKAGKSLFRILRDLVIAFTQFIIILFFFLSAFILNYIFKINNFAIVLLLFYSIFLPVIFILQFLFMYFSDIDNQVKSLLK